MSIQAMNYALSVLADLPPATHGTLLVLAHRADTLTHEYYTGDWLADVRGIDPQRVRVHVRTLAAAGVIAVEHRAGDASRVRFPVAAYLTAISTTPRENVQGSVGHPARNRAGTPRENARAPRAKTRATKGFTKVLTRRAADDGEAMPASGAAGRSILEKARRQQRAEREALG